MPAAGCVRMCQLVYQNEPGTPGKHGVEVHLVHGATTVGKHLAPDGLQALDERQRLRAAVRFHHADDDVHALAPPGLGGGQHLVALAHPGGGPQENLEASPPLPRQRTE